MEKVKLPREDFETLENSKMLGTYWKETMLKLYVERGLSFKSDFETILSALVNGYRVEQTPEEKVLRMFQEAIDKEQNVGKTNTFKAQWWEGRRMAIIDTLNALGKKVEGVNV